MMKKREKKEAEEKLIAEKIKQEIKFLKIIKKLLEQGMQLINEKCESNTVKGSNFRM